jgi:hypothetical protein
MRNMGGKSTSQSAILRDEPITRPAYDLRSWQGLTDVLRVAKEQLTREEHAAFRDLVLRYAQQGGDVELKKEIDQIIATFGTRKPAQSASAKTSAHGKESVLPKQPAPIGRRPAPRFVSRPVSVTAPEAPAPVPVVPVPSPISVVREVMPVAPLPVVEPEPVIPEIIPVAPVPPREAIQKPEPAPIQETFSAPRSVDEHKVRITEIKRLVNEQIGNPVALVGAHKEMGKEYMQALLAALKATGGGGVGVEAAMRRLEDAYSALSRHTPQADTPAVSSLAPETPAPVKEVLPSSPVVEEVKPLPIVETPVASVVEPEPEPEPVPVTPPPTPEPVRVPPAPVAVPPEKKPEPEVKPITPVPPPATVRETVPKKEPETVQVQSMTTKESVSVEPEPLPTSVPEKPTASPKEEKPAATVPPLFSAAAALAASRKEVLVTSPAPMPAPVAKEPAAPVSTIANDEGFQQTKYTQKKVGSVSTETLAASGIDTEAHEVRQSELASPKITQALHELLHEWSIFNASGFLGMGPSGPEHPLYVRLAALSMGEIITGRYEGADRKVNNVIHDYVNAWRHEQGVAYTPSETFEHYLRRVVQRIQKRQGPAV